MKISLSYIAIFLIIFVISCKKDNPTVNQSSSKQFPNQTGNYWKYSYLSPDSTESGILEVNIIGDQVFPDGNMAKVWVYRYPFITDTVYKIATASEVKEYNRLPATTDEMSPSMRYFFPMQSGDQWDIAPGQYSDSVEVVSQLILTVPAGSFDTTFLLKMIGTHEIGNYWNKNQYWFTPHIGITRQHLNLFNLGPDAHNGTYELLEYRLK